MKVDWQRLASIGTCAVLGLIFAFFLGKYAVAVLLPFIIAWLMALLTNSISRRICPCRGKLRKLCSLLILVLLFTVIGALLFWGTNRFITEIEKFIGGLTYDSDSIAESVAAMAEGLERISSRIPLLGELKRHEQLSSLGEHADRMLTSFLSGFASDLGAALTAFAASVMRALPSIVLFVIISVIASFYFTLDLDTINRIPTSILPLRLRARLPQLKQKTKSLAVRYLKAYSILMVLTFFEVFTGLSLLGVDYAFLLALGISLLDVLPVFGVGTVLIPWAIFSFISRSFNRGIGLVALWAVVTVIRQVVEPKIVGETIGLHPIATLMGMYVGYKSLGIVGMLLAPAVLIAVRSYLASKHSASAIDSEVKK